MAQRKIIPDNDVAPNTYNNDRWKRWFYDDYDDSAYMSRDPLTAEKNSFFIRDRFAKPATLDTDLWVSK